MPSRIPTPRKIQATSAKRRVVRIQLASEAAGDQGADRERERDRPEHVARVEHRRVDRHRRVAEQRVEADALGRRRVEAVERVGAEQHQAGEEEPEPGEHRGRPGDDLAVAAAGEEEDAAGGDRQHPGPEQQRAALARPHRGQLVAERGRGRGVVGDQGDGEVRAHEGRLEHDHRDRQQRAERVDRPARGVDQPPVVAPRAGDRRAGRVQARERGRDQAGGAELDHLPAPTTGSRRARGPRPPRRRTSTGTW